MRDYHVAFYEEELQPLELQGKRVLEVGCGCGDVCQLLAERGPRLNRLVGINHERCTRDQDPRYQILHMNVSQMGFADETFDLVYSLATFEHVADLPGALGQIRRILRPGGLLVAVWSPIWNGFNGHHYGSTISNPSHHDIDLPWAHLIFSPQRLPAYLVAAEGFSSAEADRATDFIFHSSVLNHLGYSEYRQIFSNAGMEVLRLQGEPVDFAGLLERIQSKLAAGHVQPEDVLRFFKRMPEEEILTYKIKVTLRK